MDAKRTAKAVADIDEVHFLKHPGGVEPIINDDLFASGDWFSVATLKGSVSINQDAISLTKINIDQSDMPIGITTEPGDFNIEFNMPSLEQENLANWLDMGTTKVKIGDKEGLGSDFNATLHQMVLAVKAKTGEWFVFPNIQGSVVMGMEDKVWVLKYSGAVLGASNEANNDVYILQKAASESA